MQTIDIFESIKFMSRLIRSEKRKTCTELRLQPIHYELLNYLSNSSQSINTPSSIADHFGMTRGTVSQSLILLEKKSYLEKIKDENDSRIIHLYVLPLGSQILKKVACKNLFNTASLILKKQNIPANVQKQLFSKAGLALQKVRSTQPYKINNESSFEYMKKPSVFDFIEYMATLIMSEERKKCAELKLQLIHFQVLDYLYICNKYSDTPASIANYMGMTRGTISQTIIILEKKGFIKKAKDSIDKRVLHIELLPKGIKTLKQAKPTELFKKAADILNKDPAFTGNEEIFIQALKALQKANHSHSFGICKTCINFTKKSSGFYCELTKEALSKSDSEKICQEHIPI